ncbi:hypothetical protein G9A89_008247 [Geosiphon pyriformis]|nr:hypothetical protein G9A89_008247 [Geosiphon pyriformis]
MEEKITECARRPSFGNRGKEIRVRSNFFEVLKLPRDNIIHYDVTIKPEVPPGLNRKVYTIFEEMNRDGILNGAMPVYDGRKNVFSHKILPFGEAYTFDVTLPEDDSVAVTKRPPRIFRLRIKKVGEIVMEELFQFLNAETSLTPNCLTGMMALDVLVRHQPSMKFTAVGRSFYNPQGSQVLYGGIEAWQGYYQSVRPGQGKMWINLDLSATAFYEGGSLIQLICKQLGKRRPDEFRRGIADKDRLKLEKLFKNLKIRAMHRGIPASKLRFRIRKFTERPANEMTFDAGDNGEIDVVTYFYKQYNIRLNYPYLPCVVVQRNTFLPVEVCEVIEGQRYIRKLNQKQTADMIKFTCLPPYVRGNKIQEGATLVSYNNNEYIKKFEMKVSNEMVTIPARILPPPTLHFHPSSQESVVQPREGVWNLRGKKVAIGASLGSWSVVVFGSEKDHPLQAVRNFVRELIVTCTDTGMNVPNKLPPLMYGNPVGDIESTLRQAWIRAGNSAKAQPQLVLIILPNTGVPLYAEIKRVGDTVIGVATQCCQGKHTVAARKQYCANICLKVNVKLGGMNSFLTPSEIQFVSERPTILIGADVSHPPPGDETRPSIAALCGSIDAKASRYSTTIRVQAGRQEIINDMADMVKDLLKTFYQTCGRKPERILLYRDGVPEGYFATVLSTELTAIRAACQSLDPSYKPTITFVVVKKRHHGRFFTMDKRESDRSGNCYPGTVVEKLITHPVEFDFYLQSHPGLQGTSRPCHYHVLLDENDFTADEYYSKPRMKLLFHANYFFNIINIFICSLQSLSYNLCYLYARCTRAVSMVPPAYYAHLVCARARFHVRGESWSDFETEEGKITVDSFATVKSELQKINSIMTIINGQWRESTLNETLTTKFYQIDSQGVPKVHVSRFTFHASRFTLHTSRFTLHASHFTLHTSRFTLHASHFTLHTSRFTLHASHFTLHTSHFKIM